MTDVLQIGGFFLEGLAIIVVGLLLAFLGVRSVALAVAASGFGLGWYLATDVAGFDLTQSLIVGAVLAAVAWVLTVVVFRAALAVVGFVAGAVVASKSLSLISDVIAHLAVTVVVTIVIAILVAVLVQRVGRYLLAVVTAVGGAGLTLSGVAELWPDRLGWLHQPDTTVLGILATATWAVLALAAWSVQRRSVS